ncbi:hypothetical protein MHI39_07295 [Heyndrickxia sp. FSL K6-6286]|uniref:hypothetical protein n=1 Tax=Heyndrickxia sp. FSL K6-6286 TaxID=2921510 RepID=UPI00315ADC11
MTKHFSLRAAELREKIAKGTCEVGDLTIAEELAMETRKLEHLALYGQLKRELISKENE